PGQRPSTCGEPQTRNPAVFTARRPFSSCVRGFILQPLPRSLPMSSFDTGSTLALVAIVVVSSLHQRGKEDFRRLLLSTNCLSHIFLSDIIQHLSELNVFYISKLQVVVLV
uniref:Uncharacterized protein n=1 Tax=Takifugu rubripes TaxID=31033 RepID=A0A674NP18_TAKRU